MHRQFVVLTRFPAVCSMPNRFRNAWTCVSSSTQALHFLSKWSSIYFKPLSTHLNQSQLSKTGATLLFREGTRPKLALLPDDICIRAKRLAYLTYPNKKSRPLMPSHFCYPDNVPISEQELVAFPVRKLIPRETSLPRKYSCTKTKTNKISIVSLYQDQ